MHCVHQCITEKNHVGIYDGVDVTVKTLVTI